MSGDLASEWASASAIERAIGRANAQQRPALVAFLTAGYPEMEGFADRLRAMAREADIIEIGVPFTDPMADGLTIQKASHKALQNGVTLKWILRAVSEVSEELDTPVLLMGYLNPLLRFGLGNLAVEAKKAGVAGFIVPDLPLEECGEFRAALEAQDLALVQLVTPVTPKARLRELCSVSSGFVYAVTVTGITGGGVTSPDDLNKYLDRVRSVSELPVCAGFGISTAAQVRALADHADGVVVGTALINALDRGENPADFLASLKASE